MRELPSVGEGPGKKAPPYISVCRKEIKKLIIQQTGVVIRSSYIKKINSLMLIISVLSRPISEERKIKKLRKWGTKRGGGFIGTGYQIRKWTKPPAGRD